jgi:transcriptional regulator with XRE-family HTH domain
MLLSRQNGGIALKIYDYGGMKNISGDRIHQARTAQRMSQADLAARMQVNGVVIEREAISKIETGDRFVTDYELMVFARVLQVSMEWLTENE